jgi:hypothetical protein
MKKISYGGYRFPPEIIHQAIWLYLRFTLSLRDVEDLLAEHKRFSEMPSAVMRRMSLGGFSTPIGATNIEMMEWVGSTGRADSQAGRST